MDFTVITYLAYIAISIILIFWVGRTLFTHGRIFLVEIFETTEIADAINKLLLVGFYLINMGYMVYNLKIRSTVVDLRECIEMLSVKMGIIILVLGAMHFFNIFVLFRLKKNKAKEQMPQYAIVEE